jgi:3-isopropylmalate/(R)-2-methylmalate dehydratase small subunit
VLLVTLPDAEVNELFQRTENNEGYRLTVDLENQTITDDFGLKVSFQVDSFRRECLLKGLDDIGLTLRLTDRIAAFEESHHPSAVMYEPVDPTLAKPAP